MERFDPYVPKERADIKRSTPRHVIEKLAPDDPDDISCMFGSGCLLPEDIPRLAKHLGINQDKLVSDYLEPVTKYNTTHFRPKLRTKPVGECVFYDSKTKKCTVHRAKPYQCRIATRSHHGPAIIEWFDANFFLNPKDPQSLREWHSRLRHRKTIPGASMEELVPDKKKRDAIIRGEYVKL
jgi:Fe-S-cluster containining protein